MVADAFDFLLEGRSVLVLDLMDDGDARSRCEALAETLKGLDAVPLTRKSFLIHTITKAEALDTFGDRLAPGDQVLVVASGETGASSFFIAFPNEEEGVYVKDSE